MKKLKEKIKEFKEKIKKFKEAGKKEKVNKIINITILTTIIVIIAILIIGLFITKNKENKTAGATVAGNEEITQILYKTISPNINAPIYTIGYYDWSNDQQILEYSVGHMEILVGNSWKRIKAVKEIKTKHRSSVTFMYKDEEGGLMNNISTEMHPTESGGENWNQRINTRVQITIREDIKMRWDGVIYYVGGRLQLYTEYAIPRILMTYMNVNTQDIQQTTDYMNSFFESGYNAGYEQGYIKGTDQTFNPIGMIITPIATFFSTPIFGHFAIGDFFTVAMFVSVALIFLKIFAGG